MCIRQKGLTAVPVVVEKGPNTVFRMRRNVSYNPKPLLRQTTASLQRELRYAQFLMLMCTSAMAQHPPGVLVRSLLIEHRARLILGHVIAPTPPRALPASLLIVVFSAGHVPSLFQGNPPPVNSRCLWKWPHQKEKKTFTCKKAPDEEAILTCGSWKDAAHSSHDSPNTSRRFALGARDVCVVGENPTYSVPAS